ncbi:hypothetical protein BC829DRAFT_387788 [Chytridium lagenaria]|nr:hypothetical protein BC829DRAFT_387788 [Chytridium lagenaria]
MVQQKPRGNHYVHTTIPNIAAAKPSAVQQQFPVGTHSPTTSTTSQSYMQPAGNYPQSFTHPPQASNQTYTPPQTYTHTPSSHTHTPPTHTHTPPTHTHTPPSHTYTPPSIPRPTPSYYQHRIVGGERTSSASRPPTSPPTHPHTPPPNLPYSVTSSQPQVSLPYSITSSQPVAYHYDQRDPPPPVTHSGLPWTG